MQREGGTGINSLYIPPDIWIVISEAVRSRELADYRRKQKNNPNNLPRWANHVILNSGDLLSLSSVCRHFRQALFPIALERLRVVPRKTKNRSRQIRMLCYTGRLLEILMEPEGRWQREFVREFVYELRDYDYDHPDHGRTPKLDLSNDVLLSLVNVRRVHLTLVDVDVGKLLGLTKLQHLLLQDCNLFNVPSTDQSRSQDSRFNIQSLQLLSSSYQYLPQDEKDVLLHAFVSPALTHLVVDQYGFNFIQQAACNGPNELALMMWGATAESERDVTAALEQCVSLQALHLYARPLAREHGVRLQKLGSLRRITCDVDNVEHLVPGRPVERLRLFHADPGSKPWGWQGYDWKTILDTIGKSTQPIKTINVIDFRRCDPQSTLRVLEELIERFGALEELGLFMQDQQGVIDAISLVARLESLHAVRIEPAEELHLDPQDWFSWREARLRELVGLSRSKNLREVDLGYGHTWRWVESKTWVHCGPKEDTPKEIYIE